MSPASLWRGPRGELLSLLACSQPGTEASNNHWKEPLWMWLFSLPVVSDSLRPYGPPSSSAHGILQARYWSGWPFPPPGDLPGPGIEPWSPALQADRLLSEPPGKP